jgi:membrane associated rhomboid family serine protease
MTTWNWLSDTRMGLIVLLFFHPIIHGSLDHLLSNAFFLIAGPLVESWMTFTRKTRYGILLLCYLVSLDVSFFGWVAITPTHRPLYGLSSMISSALAFALVYVWVFRRHLRFRGWNALAFLGISALLLTFVWNTLNVVVAVLTVQVSIDYLYQVAYHVAAFVQSVPLGYLLFRRLRKGEAHLGNR